MLRHLRAPLVLLVLAAVAVAAWPALGSGAPAQRRPTDRATGSQAAACAARAGDQTVAGVRVHVPPHPRTPLALVLAFHGAHGTGAGFAQESGLSRTADRHGFAVAYPTATGPDRYWSLNAHTGPDDVAALTAALGPLEATTCADPRRIFATGVSNGGGFAARVGCELAGTIAAIAPVAGSYRSLDACPVGRHVSVLEIHGDADHIVPYAGRRGDGAGSVAGFLGGWVARDGCRSRADRVRLRRGVVLFAHDCPGGLAVEHIRLHGTDHGWPGAAPPWPRHNPSGLTAGEAVWAFFARHPLPAPH